VDWVLGEEALLEQTRTDVSLDSSERVALETFLNAGGALFISGSEIAWDLDYHGHDRDFYRGLLRARYAEDDAGTYQVTPVFGSIFDGMDGFGFDAPGEYDADYPDILSPHGGSTEALRYAGGAEGSAAVQHEAGCQRVVNFGFPFETILPARRSDVMNRVMGFLDECLFVVPETVISSPAHEDSYRGVPAFQGSAFSSRGIQRVDVSLRREEDGAYWDGASWTSAPWQVAAGTTEWSFTMPVTLSAGAYTGRAQAWDTAAISDATPAEVSFTIVADSVYLPLAVRAFAFQGPSCEDLIANGGFEVDAAWEIVSTAYLAGYSTDHARTGERGMRVGIPPDEAGGGVTTYSSISQTISLPAVCTATLRYWVYPVYEDLDDGDLQYVWLVDEDGSKPILLRLREDDREWKQHEVDLSQFAGRTVHLRFSVKNDGDDLVAATYLDDVRVEVCGDSRRHIALGEEGGR
jgi:hypothetical protein